MRPLRYSINVTLDACCDHRANPADEELHRHAVANVNRADALLVGWLTHDMMEAAFRSPAQTGDMPIGSGAVAMRYEPRRWLLLMQDRQR